MTTLMTEVAEAIKQAAEAFRNAERALADAADEQAPAGQALLDLIASDAANRKKKEESDPGTFAERLAGLNLDLLRLAVDRQMFLTGPAIPGGATKHEVSPAATSLAKLLEVMTKTGLSAPTLLAEFTSKPLLKNWSDINPETEYVLVRYQTPGPVEHVLELSTLAAHVDAAREVPGTVEEVVSELAAMDIGWQPFKDQALNPVVVISSIDAYWCAAVDVMAIAEAVASRLSMVQASIQRDPVWWAGATASTAVPKSILALIRGKNPSCIVKRDDVAEIQSWMTSLPRGVTSPIIKTPQLMVRDCTIKDILA